MILNLVSLIVVFLFLNADKNSTSLDFFEIIIFLFIRYLSSFRILDVLKIKKPQSDSPDLRS